MAQLVEEQPFGLVQVGVEIHIEAGVLERLNILAEMVNLEGSLFIHDGKDNWVLLSCLIFGFLANLSFEAFREPLFADTWEELR